MESLTVDGWDCIFQWGRGQAQAFIFREQKFFLRCTMFSMGQSVQIYNHSDVDCNGEYGTIIDVDVAYSGERYYTVELEGYKYCECTEDELVEG